MLTRIDIVIRLLVAVALGIIVGYEKETHDEPAGLRTHAIVSIGACLFTLTGILIAQDSPGKSIDASRITAGIVTGIGFLGAGAMFQEKNRLSD